MGKNKKHRMKLRSDPRDPPPPPPEEEEDAEPLEDAEEEHAVEEEADKEVAEPVEEQVAEQVEDAEEESDEPEEELEYDEINDTYYYPSQEAKKEYEDDEESDEEEEDDDDDEDDEDEPIEIFNKGTAGKPTGNVVVVIGGGSSGRMVKKRKKECCGEDETIEDGFSPEEQSYWDKLENPDKEKFIVEFKKVKNSNISGIIPLKFKILNNADMDLGTKNILMAKIDQFNNMSENSGEYFKLRNWLQAAARIPFNKTNPLPIKPSDPVEKCSDFLTSVRRKLDDTVYGHAEAKDQILRILAQWISNPTSQGHCIGIQGSMGTGKTSLVKEGICKALNLAFGFIALGGASDGSFLDGHSFTYEGSTYGKIAEVLMKTQCMNPVIFFDELDKVSTTHRGDEIIGILTHLTDSSQNEKFNDRYFGEIDLDLSKSLIIFSYNDESRINPILKDRLITIHVKGYNNEDKLKIARDYLLPQILKEYNISKEDIVFTDSVINAIIQRVKSEEGVRNLKRGLEALISWINMLRYTEKDKIKFPVIVKDEDVKKYLKSQENNISLNMMYL